MKLAQNNSENQLARTLLFIGYYDISNITSAPQVRISAMIRAFKSMGCESVIVGGRWNRAWQQLKWIFLLKSRGITHAYIENASTTAWPMDLIFLVILKLFKIKIGIFIRDVYPAFSYFRSRLIWYQVPFYWGWHLSVRVYVAVANHIFTPTEDFIPFLKPRPVNYSALPPAMSHPPANMFDIESKQFLYMGGISELYGLEYLTKSLDQLQKLRTGGGIDFIVRDVPDQLREYSNARIQSMPFAEIAKQGRSYLAGIITTHEPYSQITVNVKLFDYLSLGLPVIITNMKGNATIVQKENIGLITDSPQEIPDLLARILSDPTLLLPYKEKINDKLYTAHNWNNRVMRIINKLYV